MAAAVSQSPVCPDASRGRLRRSARVARHRTGHIDVAGDAVDPARSPGWRTGADAGPRTTDDESYFTLCMHSEPIGTTTASLVAAVAGANVARHGRWVDLVRDALHGRLPAGVSRRRESPPSWRAVDPNPTRARRGGRSRCWQDAATQDFPRHTSWLRQAWKGFESRIGERAHCRSSGKAARARASGSHSVVTKLLTDFMARTWRDAIAQAARNWRVNFLNALRESAVGESERASRRLRFFGDTCRSAAHRLCPREVFAARRRLPRNAERARRQRFVACRQSHPSRSR